MTFIESMKAKLTISDDSKQKIKYIFLVILSITLIVLSFLNIRSGTDNDDKKTTDIISAINICSYIILILSLPILARCLWFFYTIRDGKYYQEIEIVDKLLIFVFPLVILIVSIVLKVYVSNYLPDMNNPDEVEKYNKTHTLNAESVNNSSTGILVIGIILFVMSIGFAYYTSKSLPDVQKVQPQQPIHPSKLQESEFDKEMRQLKKDKEDLEKYVKNMRELYMKREVTEDLLAEYEHALGSVDLKIKEKQAMRAKQKKERDEEIKKKSAEYEETYKKSTQRDIMSTIRGEGIPSIELDITKYPEIKTVPTPSLTDSSKPTPTAKPPGVTLPFGGMTTYGGR